MAEKRRVHLLVASPARRDIADIVKRSLREFGEDAALRYQALIRQALLDIQSDPERPGSKTRPEFLVEGARTYHISLSRDRLSHPRVGDPRHFILYRLRPDGAVEVARILHDSRDIARHLPEEYRRTEGVK